MKAEDGIPLEHASALDWLRYEYFRRKSKNRSYSLRSFARQLQISPGPLSEILSKRRSLTAKLITRLAENLSYSPVETEQILNLEKGSARRKKRESKADPISKQLEADTFSLIADWYHYAILSLMETKRFRNDPKWIAKRLGISSVEVRAALERLLRLRLIEQTEDRLVATQGWTTTHDVPSAAIRKFHRQSLELSMDALETASVDRRDVTSITMAIDVSKWDAAKKQIRGFRRRMARFLEEGEKTEVYQLSIQLIPLTKGKS